MKTFVIRLFVPGQGEAPGSGSDFHGFLEEVASGRRTRFGGGQELLELLFMGLGNEPAQVVDGS